MRRYALILPPNHGLTSSTSSMDSSRRHFVCFGDGGGDHATETRFIPSFESRSSVTSGDCLFILLLVRPPYSPCSISDRWSRGVGAQWFVFFQSDVLHCIAVSLLILQMMLLIAD
jgi:hypothetical protein